MRPGGRAGPAASASFGTAHGCSAETAGASRPRGQPRRRARAGAAIRGGGPPATRGGPVLAAPTGALVAAVAGFLPDTLLHDDRLAGTPVASSPFDPMNLIP